jgi:hypothetical protein
MGMESVTHGMVEKLFINEPEENGNNNDCDNDTKNSEQTKPFFKKKKQVIP